MSALLCHPFSVTLPLSALLCHPSSVTLPLSPSAVTPLLSPLCRHSQLQPCLPCTPRCFSSSPAVLPLSCDFPHEPKDGTPQHPASGRVLLQAPPKSPTQDRVSTTAGVPGRGTGWARCCCCGEQSWPCPPSQQNTLVPGGISGCSAGRAARRMNGTGRRVFSSFIKSELVGGLSQPAPGNLHPLGLQGLSQHTTN